MLNQNQNPTFDIEKDGLFCDEQEKDLDFGYGFILFEEKVPILKQKDLFYTHFEHDLLWEEDELFTLLAKEKNSGLGDVGGLINDNFLLGLRKESVDWMIRVSNYYGFVALTTILAVNYFDRFLFSPNFQRDKPWMNQLAAVACLSLASKVEEIQAPLLMDLQVEGTKFVFESKTIMKMELLVLSSLQWKMNPVTPLSFLDYIMRRLGLITHNRHIEIVKLCEKLVLAVINDSRYLDYLPSVMAAATIIHVIQEVDPNNAFDYKNRLNVFLEINEEKVEDCSEFILDVSDNIHGTRKRKYHCAPESPIGVIDSYFSSDNSSDSWSLAAPSPEPVLKRIRVQEQQMRMGPGIRGSGRTVN